MKDTTIDKVRKTCGNCALYDKRQKQCSKSEFSVNTTRARPNCKNWALAKDAPEPVTQAVPTPVEAPEEVQAPCKCCEHVKMPERDDIKEALPERKTEEVELTKENPIQHWLKKIGIVK